jgi:hypothetical protein
MKKQEQTDKMILDLIEGLIVQIEEIQKVVEKLVKNLNK